MARPTIRMNDLKALWRGLVRREPGGADRAVPATGYTANLTLVTAGAMAFLAVFALSLSLATGRLAERWSAQLADSMTVRITAPLSRIDDDTRKVMEILRTTPGAGEARVIGDDEVQKLLEPWFGPDIPVDALPVPRLIELTRTERGFDSDGLRLRLQADAPDAVLDDHTRWRQPLVSAASRLRWLGFASLVLITVASAAMLTLAAQAALAANGQVIRVMRLIGARDLTIATAFVRRITRLAATGALVGTVVGMIGIWALPDMDAAGGFLTGLGFQGAGWLWPLLIPAIAGVIAFFATRWAALRVLSEVR